MLQVSGTIAFGFPETASVLANTISDTRGRVEKKQAQVGRSDCGLRRGGGAFAVARCGKVWWSVLVLLTLQHASLNPACALPPDQLFLLPTHRRMMK